MLIKECCFSLALVGLLSAGPAGFAQADSPLSAIDWLSNTVSMPPAAPAAPPKPTSETDVTSSAAVSTITVTSLDAPSPDAVGLLPPSVTGLPRTLWGQTSVDDLARLIRNQPAKTLPALQDLLHMVLLAEVDPPLDADAAGKLFLARIDKLLDIGALEQAAAMLERTGSTAPEVFRRSFDVALLTGNEDAACNVLRTQADIAPTFPARIFCLARNGDWNTAALTLDTGKVLGYITAEEDALLAQFLEPELFDETARLPTPKPLTPLLFRIREAIGAPISTRALPRAFANADLRSNAGWKPQLEAAERLAATGAMDPNKLLGLYSERLPAASGGIWERVGAVQKFDTAYRAGDPGAITKTLPRAWTEIKRARLENIFATLYGEGLSHFPLQEPATSLAFEIGLLSRDYELVVTALPPQNPRDRFLAAIATGEVAGIPAPDATAKIIQAAFGKTATPEQFAPLLENNQLGEAILRALILFSDGVRGDKNDITDALALFRAVGLEDTARRAALELMLLDWHE